MEEKEEFNQDLLNYITENFKATMESDFEEKVYGFPYTRCLNTFFQRLKKEYNIDFNADFISDKLLDKVVEEFLLNITK